MMAAAEPGVSDAVAPESALVLAVFALGGSQVPCYRSYVVIVAGIQSQRSSDLDSGVSVSFLLRNDVFHVRSRSPRNYCEPSRAARNKQ